jgi:tRNA(Glu) U13 pseudouridine synthase TruD/glycerol dehydrogenase-like iron-containing ADH family enzyme
MTRRLTQALPSVGGAFKQTPETFSVTELPLYEPAGDGYHLYITLEKTGWNTRDVVSRAGEVFGLPERDIGYAGLKDKYAVARQTISVLDVKEEDAHLLETDGISVVSVAKHRNKLRVGHLAGNRFEIRLKAPEGGYEGGPEAAALRATAILDALMLQGLPNYYGKQRFGFGGDNVKKALGVLKNGPRAAGSKWKARFLLSALQSHLFNEVLDRRIDAEAFGRALTGDVLQKVASGGCFVCDDPVVDQARLDSGELSITGPIAGVKMKLPGEESQSAVWEAEALESAELTIEDFRRVSKLAPGARRPLRATVTAGEAVVDGEDLLVRFSLPPGSYATVLINELLDPPPEPAYAPLWRGLPRLKGECACGRSHAVATRAVVIERGAVVHTGQVGRILKLGTRVLLVADPETHAAAGLAAHTSLEAAGFTVRTWMLDSHPVAGPALVDQVSEQVGDADALVAVGSGTVNDIVKSAAQASDKPYMVVATALSMNGYASGISALLVEGVKRTLPATPALGVVIDLDICAGAPVEMTLAGLGDMLSKPFSEADWRLSHHLQGDYHCEKPGAILGHAFQTMVSEAGPIGRSEPDALRSLAESIVLSGVSMTMAGQSSPASGGEHLLSHYWDMLCYGRDRHPFALHGTQVGVACCLVEPLYHAISQLDASGIDVDACLATWPETEAAAADRIRARHLDLPDDVRERVVVEALQKWRPPVEQRARLEWLKAELEGVLTHIRAALLPPGAIIAALEAAGAPTTAAGIDASFEGGLDRWGHARDMRSRYTILDLAAELGRLKG